MWKTQLDDQTVARIQCHTVFDRNRKGSFRRIPASGIGLSNARHSCRLLPHFIIFEFLIRIIAGKFVNRHITVKLIPKGKVFIGVIHSDIDARRIALYRRHLKRCIRCTPVRRRLHLDDVGTRLLSIRRHHQLQLCTGCQLSLAVKSDALSSGIINGTGGDNLVGIHVKLVASKLIQLERSL